MKKFYGVGFLALGAIALAGCFSKPKVLYRMDDAKPPDFLAGPAALLLTNVDGFSATMTASTATDAGARHLVAGDILGREGLLIYQPQSAAKGKRARSEGGMFFIWNETAQVGFVLSDPLQAFAPTSVAIKHTNVVFDTSGATQEEVNGHPCRRIDAIVQSSDGSSARFKVWQAEDMKLFPVRIASPPGPGEMVLNFSDVRLELPPPELFGPPDGFIRYDSPLTLVNELIIRQSALAGRDDVRGEIQLSSQPGSTVPNWRPNPGQ